MLFVLKQIWQVGYFPHNLDHLEKEWATENKAYADTHTLQDILTTRYNRFKERCIIETGTDLDPRQCEKW